jgi:hypothetical protein
MNIGGIKQVNSLFSQFNSNLPEDIQKYLAPICASGIQVILHGGSLTDHLTGDAPDDYDFFCCCNAETLKSIVKKNNLALSSYGSYVFPAKHIFYGRTEKGTKLDISLVSDISLQSLQRLKYKRGLAAPNTFISFYQQNIYYDLFIGVEAIHKKKFTIATQLDKTNRQTIEATFAIFCLSFLHGKHSDFSLDTVSCRLLKLSSPSIRGDTYFSTYPWRVTSDLLRCFTYSSAGIRNISNYWRMMSLERFFFPEISPHVLRTIINNPTLNGLEMLIQINQHTNGELFKNMLTQIKAIPKSYFEAMKPERKKFILKIQSLGQ